MTLRRTLPAAAASLVLAGLLCWGGALPGTVPVAQADTAFSGQLSGLAMIPGSAMDLGAYQATVPDNFVAHRTGQTMPDMDPEIARTLPHTWQLISTDDIPLVLTLVSTPYLDNQLDTDDIKRINQADDPRPEADALLDLIKDSFPGDNPTCIGFLPYREDGLEFNLLFFTGLQPERVTATAILPGTETSPEPSILTAVFSSQAVEQVLPAIDGLFGSVAIAQTEAEHAAQALADYKEQRDR